MGRRGPTPQSPAFADGLELAAPDARPPIPLDRRATKEWRRLLGQLGRQRTVTQNDLGILAVHCAALSLIAECDTRLAKEGVTVPGRAGTTVKNPLVSIRSGAVDQVLRSGRELGLSPLSRPSVKPLDSSAVDDEIEAKYFRRAAD